MSFDYRKNAMRITDVAKRLVSERSILIIRRSTALRGALYLYIEIPVHNSSQSEHAMRV